jgi:hypothetical protein
MKDRINVLFSDALKFWWDITHPALLTVVATSRVAKCERSHGEAMVSLLVVIGHRKAFAL